MSVAADRQHPTAADGALPPVQASRTQQKSSEHHAKYHKCRCYGHEKALPDYKLLAMPRTNNYYAATGGCPCIPRAAAHPGSWRLKEAQMRSSTYKCGSGCVNAQTSPKATHQCCLHSGAQYGWKAGPHTVADKNTAATGKCDTFGNMAFKSTGGRRSAAAGGSAGGTRKQDDGAASEVSSASPQKLDDLEALILEEHDARMRVESDVEQLKDIHQSGTRDQYGQNPAWDSMNGRNGSVSQDQLDELLREVKRIVDFPLNQTNMERLDHIIQRQEFLQSRRPQ